MRSSPVSLYLVCVILPASCAQQSCAGTQTEAAATQPQTAAQTGAAAEKPSRTKICGADGVLPDLDDLHARYDETGPAPLEVHLDVADQAGLDAVLADRPGAEVAVHFREGSFGAGDTAPNAVMRQRGLTVRLANQKSFRIKLKGAHLLWRGQKIIHLNKHPWDLSRVRQKLSFDIFRTVPHLASLDTRFVHLFLNGEDQGLYTAIENPDEHFLKAHGLPPGQVVMPVYFDFATIPETVWKKPEQLARHIEFKTEPDEPKLKRLLAAVNNPALPIDQVVRRFLDRRNYVTWLAANLVVGNWDMGASNYLIYSPAGCEGWYFLPWDYDGAWDWYGQPGVPPEQRNRWRSGLSVYWGSMLHSRFLREPGNVAEVEARMVELAQDRLSPARVQALLDRYRDAVAALTRVPPDVWYLHTPTLLIEERAFAAWQREYARLPEVVVNYLKEYREVKARPTPVWLNHVINRRTVYFEWGRSFHFEGEPLTYDFQLARSSSFAPGTLIAERKDIAIPDGELVGSVTLPRPRPGQYFWRVIVRAAGHPDRDWQVPYDIFWKLVLR